MGDDSIDMVILHMDMGYLVTLLDGMMPATSPCLILVVSWVNWHPMTWQTFYAVLPPVVSSIGVPLILTVKIHQIETRVGKSFREFRRNS
jgi:hypothetical protein